MRIPRLLPEVQRLFGYSADIWFTSNELALSLHPDDIGKSLVRHSQVYSRELSNMARRGHIARRRIEGHRSQWEYSATPGRPRQEPRQQTQSLADMLHMALHGMAQQRPNGRAVRRELVAA